MGRAVLHADSSIVVAYLGRHPSLDQLVNAVGLAREGGCGGRHLELDQVIDLFCNANIPCPVDPERPWCRRTSMLGVRWFWVRACSLKQEVVFCWVAISA